MVANSWFKLASVTSCISSAVCFLLVGPILSKVAVASEMTYVSYPKFLAILAVEDTQWSVVSPTRITCSICSSSKNSFKEVPIKALFTSFSITFSFSSGCTIFLKLFPGRPFARGDGDVPLCFICTIGRSLVRQNRNNVHVWGSYARP